MTTDTQSDYEKFHEWLNDCPVEYWISDTSPDIIEFNSPQHQEEN